MLPSHIYYWLCTFTITVVHTYSEWKDNAAIPYILLIVHIYNKVVHTYSIWEDNAVVPYTLLIVHIFNKSCAHLQWMRRQRCRPIYIIDCAFTITVVHTYSEWEDNAVVPYMLLIVHIYNKSCAHLQWMRRQCCRPIHIIDRHKTQQVLSWIQLSHLIHYII